MWNGEGNTYPRADCPTLSKAISKIASDEALDKKERIHRCSGLRTFARCLGLSSELIPISAQYFRSRLRMLTPTSTNLSERRLATIKSQLGFVLKYVYGGEGVRPRGREIGPLFTHLLLIIDDKWERMALIRFFSFCTRAQINPYQVDNDLFRQYCEYLVNATLAASPLRNARMVRNVWNNCARTYPAWPKVYLIIAGRSRSSPQLQKTFEDDVERYKKFLVGLTGHPVTGEFILQPLVQSSILQHIRALYRCAAAAQTAGFRPDSIADLFRVDALAALQNQVRSADRQVSSAYTHRQMVELRLAARRWTLESPAIVLRRPYLAANAESRSSTTKFRQIFGLLEAEALAQLLDLPAKLMAQAVRYDIKHPKRRAIAQAALAIEIMLMVPLSPAQLLDLRMDVSIIDDPLVGDGMVILVHHAQKPRRELRYQMPKRSAELIRAYRSILLTYEQESVWLFQSKDGGHRQPAAFGETISRQILKHVGVQVVPRALRFLGGTLYLLKYPDRYETVRQAMGHRSLAHTRRMFGFVRAVQSARQFDAVLRHRTGREDM